MKLYQFFLFSFLSNTYKIYVTHYGKLFTACFCYFLTQKRDGSNGERKARECGVFSFLVAFPSSKVEENTPKYRTVYEEMYLSFLRRLRFLLSLLLLLFVCMCVCRFRLLTKNQLITLFLFRIMDFQVCNFFFFRRGGNRSHIRFSESGKKFALPLPQWENLYIWAMQVCAIQPIYGQIIIPID